MSSMYITRHEGMSDAETLVNEKQPAPAPRLQSRAAKIAVPVQEGLEMLDIEEIVKCVAYERSTEIVMASGARFLVARVLKDYEAMLAEFNFFRIHNSSLINLRHVKRYIRGDGGQVLLSNGDCCEVSRRKKTALMERLSLVIF